MSGDYTRFSFNPAKGFSGVHKQQGRVSLDSDFNEFEEILDRRDRAEMYDTVGQTVVPLTTPHGFEISVAAGKLMIGIGRVYVDGILAECFGDLSDPTKTVRDDNLGGVVGSGPVAYDHQPFYYQPGFPVLSPTPGDMNLVYLDVWQREVTVFEDEALLEPALNGPDTATRVQTAWQVKVMPHVDTTNCAQSPTGWDDLIAASTARLTAQATPAAPAAGPCIINPAGGYTGLENRLYRVEIHKAGTLGGATKAQFKWSRDNASLTARVVLPITKISAAESVITVSSTGRDAWMRFEHGDHIELLDDDVELAMREKGKSGEMAGVLSVNHATGEIHVDKDLSTLPLAAARHPRIRRWDIATAAEPLVRAADNGVTIPLEEGITITFGGAATDTLHAGDYWVFAARTADGTIETLVNAPPRGILHHFTKLALVKSGTPTVLSDCRPFWPAPCCCCTVEVGDGETSHGEFNKIAEAYAAALGRVQDAETTIRICILPGNHKPGQKIVIDRPHVTVSGCGRSSRIYAPAGGTIFEAHGSWFRLEHVYLVSAFSTPTPLVRVGGVGEVRIENNLFEGPRGTLLSCERTFNSVIFRNAFFGTQAILTNGWGMVIAQNRFFGSGSFIGLEDTGMIELRGSGDQAWAAWVLENQISNGPGHGIILSEGTGTLYDVVIDDNQIQGVRGSGIATARFSGLLAPVSPQVFSGTAPVYIDGLRIEQNTITGCARTTWKRGDGAPQGGIVVGGVRHLLIADNRIAGNGANQPIDIPVAGIYVGHGEGLIVRDNVVTGNGRQGGKVERIEGGIVVLDLVAPMETLWQGGFDVNSTVVDVQRVVIFDDGFTTRPDGWPAAMVHGNLVVSPSGRALTLLGTGPMEVTDNRLISRQLVPAPGWQPTAYTGAVLIQTSQSSLGSWRGMVPAGTIVEVETINMRWTDAGVSNLLLSGDGNVIFSDNDVVLDEARPGVPDPTAPPRQVVQIVVSDDLAFHDNVIRCLAGAGDLSENTSLQGVTTRATGNGVFEAAQPSSSNSLFLYRPSNALLCTVTDNQASHCIQVVPMDASKVRKVNNLESPGCPDQFTWVNRGMVLSQVEESRQATLARIADLSRSEEVSLQEQKITLAETVGPEDPRVKTMEARIQGAARRRESIELGLRMSERAKEIQEGDWTLMGRVLDTAGRPIAGARLELWEGDHGLTEIKADKRGEIFTRYSEKKFKDIFKRAPQLKVIVKAADGTVLQTLEQTLTPVANQVETFELRIEEAPSRGQQPGKPRAKKQATPGPAKAAATARKKKAPAKRKPSKRVKEGEGTGSKPPRGGGKKKGA